MTWINLPDSAPGAQPEVRAKAQWYEFRNGTTDEAELLIFSEIGWWGILADEFVEELNAVTASKLTVRVNSPGGSVFQGVAIGNALRAHPATVTVRVEGLAASIASVIALAGDRLVMAPNSMFMIHDASGGCWGDAEEMRKMAEVLDKISDNIADAYAAKAGGTRAEWRERMLAETWYTADEAVEAGLADELLVPPKPDREEPDDAAKRMAAQWDLSVFRYAGRSNAPAPPSPAPTDQAPALETPASPVEAHTPEPAPAPPEPEPAAVEPAPEPEPQPDAWASAVAHLITPPSTEDVWDRLREALL